MGGVGRWEGWGGWECEPKPANAWSWVCEGNCGTGGTSETGGTSGTGGTGETSGRTEKAGRIERAGASETNGTGGTGGLLLKAKKGG